MKITKRGRHVYIDGTKMLSPSTITSRLFPLPPIPDYILQASIRRGNEVGEAIQQLEITGDYEISNEYEPIMKQFKEFVKDFKIELLESEKLVLKALKSGYLGGYVDIVATMRGKPIYIEVKTRDLIKYPEPYIYNKIQTSIYKICQGGTHYILSLDSKGRSYALYKIEQKDMKQAQEAINIYNQLIELEKGK